MTEQDWKIAEQHIHFTKPLKFIIDGYDIQVQLMPIKSDMKLVYVVYVNGYIKGKWMDKECEIAQKFYWRRERNYYSRKEIKQLEKIWGKREAKKHGAYKKHVYYQPSYNSFTTLKNTFKTNNKSIELRTEIPEEV